MTPQQELFLEYLFNDDECRGSTMKACEKAGFTKNYHSVLVKELKDEILSRTQDQLVSVAPKAAAKLVALMDEDGSTPKAEIRLKATESVLDRLGVAKKQDLGIQIEAESPLFFIPAKQDVRAPEAQQVTE